MLQITKVEWMGDRCDASLQEKHLISALRNNVELEIQKIMLTRRPPELYCDELQYFGEVLCEKGDVLLYPTKKTIDEAQEIFRGLVRAIAVLAFVKSGVEVFGYRYEAAIDGRSKT
ncbi:hypothetical protein HY772_05560 [Candidatus Woesearchaeota archaeon]|nr:hypothetical protein [Candidatus Woesearchaeota archaeon]